jgi:hypothetical protein
VVGGFVDDCHAVRVLPRPGVHSGMDANLGGGADPPCSRSLLPAPGANGAERRAGPAVRRMNPVAVQKGLEMPLGRHPHHLEHSRSPSANGRGSRGADLRAHQPRHDQKATGIELGLQLEGLRFQKHDENYAQPLESNATGCRCEI